MALRLPGRGFQDGNQDKQAPAMVEVPGPQILTSYGAFCEGITVFPSSVCRKIRVVL